MNEKQHINSQPESSSQDSLKHLFWDKRITNSVEGRFLEHRGTLLKETFRSLRIFWEYIKGFYAFRDVHKCVTVFGSARFNQKHEYYQLARNLGQQLGKAGFTVMTGGGPGIMEAANRGAQDVKARSIGCNIRLPAEQAPNQYLDKWITFRYFFVRKIMLTKYSLAFIAMPGGFGTLDELFEMATLIQTGKLFGFPLVLMGCAFWQPMLDFLQNTMVSQGTIDEADLRKLLVTDSPAEALIYIQNFIDNHRAASNVNSP